MRFPTWLYFFYCKNEIIFNFLFSFLPKCFILMNVYNPNSLKLFLLVVFIFKFAFFIFIFVLFIDIHIRTNYRCNHTVYQATTLWYQSLVLTKIIDKWWYLKDEECILFPFWYISCYIFFFFKSETSIKVNHFV